MPKGVYNRGKVATPTPVAAPLNNGEIRVNTVKVSQMPDRQSANANVESMRQTSGDQDISTTERLFGDIAVRDRLDETDPNRSEEVPQDPLRETEPVAQNPEQAEQPKFQQQPKPIESKPSEQKEVSEDDFIDWDKMSGKKIRQKIDGKEVIVTAEELKKYSDQDQIKKHLAEAADKVGDERRKLAEERRQIQELRQQRQPQYEAPIRQEFANNQPQGIQSTAQLPQVQDPYLQRIQFLETKLQQLAQGTQPVIYQSNRQRVSDELKGQGFNDFLDYIPKMEAQMSTIQDSQLVSFYDTPQGAKALYFQLKAQDMNKAPAKNVPQGTSQRVVESQSIPAIQVDGGSSSGSHVDDSGHNYKAAFKRAVNSVDDREAWNEVLRQKGILPD